MSNRRFNLDGVQRFRAAGTGNMGDVTVDSDPIRFGLTTPFYLLGIKVRFTGGTSSATFQLKRRHADRRGWEDATTDGHFDFIEVQVLTAGTDATDQIFWRADPDELDFYRYEAGEMLVPEWTNPNSQKWGLEIYLAKVG